MGAFGGLLLLMGAFFVYKAFTAEKSIGGRRSLGKIDAGIYAALFIGMAFWIFWNT